MRIHCGILYVTVNTGTNDLHIASQKLQVLFLELPFLTNAFWKKRKKKERSLFLMSSRSGHVVAEVRGSWASPQWLWVSHINILTVVFISGPVQGRVTPQRQTALQETARGTQMGSEGENWNWCIMKTCGWNIKHVLWATLKHLRRGQSHCSLSEELNINKITVKIRE